MELDRQRRERRAMPAPRVIGEGLPSIQSLMKAEQLASTGLLNLSAPEMYQLNLWFGGFINSYAKPLYEVFLTQNRSSGGLDGSRQDIAEVSGNGDVIKLLDGSEWRVDVGDTVHTALWLSASGIVLVKATGSDDVLLIRDQEVAHATRIR